MDGSNNNNNGNGNPNNDNKEIDPRTMSRGEYMRNVRAAMDERRQRAMSNRQQFAPQIHEQIQRMFQGYQPPLHSRLRGFGKPETLALAEAAVLSLAALNNRPFEDSETKALTEHFIVGVQQLMAWKWFMTSMAATMAYVGRKTYRFPFFTPQFKRFSPIGGSPGIQYMWHAARFSAYYGAWWVMGEPVFQGWNFMRQRKKMEQDPRLQSLIREGKSQGATIFGGAPEVGNQENDGWGAASQQESGEFEQNTQAAQQQSSWASYRTPTQPQTPPQQAESSWGASTPDNFDDASPLASSSRNAQPSSNTTGGSSWDRIRQQAQYQPPNRQDQKTWERPQSRGSWSTESDPGAQQQGSPRESYTFSTAEEEKNLAKSQAQREFDRLLEKERSGQDQESGSWSKR